MRNPVLQLKAESSPAIVCMFLYRNVVIASCLAIKEQCSSFTVMHVTSTEMFALMMLLRERPEYISVICSLYLQFVANGRKQAHHLISLKCTLNTTH